MRSEFAGSVDEGKQDIVAGILNNHGWCSWGGDCPLSLALNSLWHLMWEARSPRRCGVSRAQVIHRRSERASHIQKPAVNHSLKMPKFHRSEIRFLHSCWKPGNRAGFQAHLPHGNSIGWTDPQAFAATNTLVAIDPNIRSVFRRGRLDYGLNGTVLVMNRVWYAGGWWVWGGHK